MDSTINSKGFDEKKTNAGIMKISNAEQTAVDLIKFQDRIGGLSRASTLIYELAESINPEILKSIIISCIQNTVLQRLGYIWKM